MKTAQAALSDSFSHLFCDVLRIIFLKSFNAHFIKVEIILFANEIETFVIIIFRAVFDRNFKSFFCFSDPVERKVCSIGLIRHFDCSSDCVAFRKNYAFVSFFIYDPDIKSFTAAIWCQFLHNKIFQTAICEVVVCRDVSIIRICIIRRILTDGRKKERQSVKLKVESS